MLRTKNIHERLFVMPGWAGLGRAAGKREVVHLV